MKNRLNVSVIVLGVVSLLFLFSLTFFSQSNTSEPVTASTFDQQEEETYANEDQSSNERNSDNEDSESNVTNKIDNSINSNNGDVENTVKNHVDSSNSNVKNQVTNEIIAKESSVSNTIENQVDSENADVTNTVDNAIFSDSKDVANSIANDINVTVDVNVTNHINNAITDGSENGEGSKNGEENGNGENGNDEDTDNGENGENGNGEDPPETVWGVDSASITTEDMLACVRNNFGDPEIWGRYLGTNEGASYGLTAEEVDLLHSENIQILVIYNHFNDGTGYEHGQDHANAALEMARDFGIPEGVALFANVEPIYPIDSAFIQGWHDIVSDSEYSSGIYGIFDRSEELYTAFEAAAEADPSILEEMYVWTAAPNEGITTQENAPVYNPSYPDGAVIGGWQYGLDAEACNIDTNIFDGNVLDVLW